MATKTVSIPTKFKTINGESILGTGDISVASTGVSVESVIVTLPCGEDIGLTLTNYKYLNLTVGTWASGDLHIEFGQESSSYSLDEPIKIEFFKNGSSLQWTMFITYNQVNLNMLNAKTTKLYVEVGGDHSLLFNFSADNATSSDIIQLYGYGIK